MSRHWINTSTRMQRIGNFLKSLFCFLLRKYLRKIFNEQRASLKAITIFPAEQQDVRKNISFFGFGDG